MAMAPKASPAPQPAWRKSSRCQSGECAEIAQQNGEIVLRSTRSPDAVVRLTAAEWQAFARGIQTGEFNDLC
jgi:Domain of unknown function (DUF397)